MPRKLVTTDNITLDGVVEDTGSWFDPHGRLRTGTAAR